MIKKLIYYSFTETNYLPTASYYAVKDLDTNEYVIDYDTTYTQLSSDANGNYFDICLLSSATDVLGTL